MLWQTAKQIQLTLEDHFNAVALRMQNLPIINPALNVQALGFTRMKHDWLGILITPWFMNLLLLPGGEDSEWRVLAPGAKFERPFPFGSFEFTVADQAHIGRYALCSLFSPMFQFTEQADAVAAAEAALQALLAAPEPRRLSRRELLRGDLARP
ncbi:MAG: [NiFe]-hydrogenase assembly chaperone HybE [Methylomonas sp.]